MLITQIIERNAQIYNQQSALLELNSIDIWNLSLRSLCVLRGMRLACRLFPKSLNAE